MPLQVFFISIGSRVQDFTESWPFLDLVDNNNTDTRFSFTFVFSVKEITLAQLVSNIQWTGGWFIGVYYLAGVSAIVGILGTYWSLPWLVDIFLHMFWARFVFDSIVFIFFTNGDVTTVDPWAALTVYIAIAIAWNLVGVLLFNFLDTLADQLEEEKKVYP